MFLVKLIFLEVTVLSQYANCQPCTWPSAFQNTAWEDSDKGYVNFTDTGMVGWRFQAEAYSIDFTEWECYTQTDSQLVVKSVSSYIAFGGDRFYNFYLCMEMTKITEHSYYYYLHSHEQPVGNYERVGAAFATATPATSDLCNETPAISEYHVLVQLGFVQEWSLTCPYILLGQYHYSVNNGTGDSCGTGDELWDVCTDNQYMTFNYTICPTEIASSASGNVICVATLTDGDNYYVTVYNTDATIDDAHFRFTCFLASLDGDVNVQMSQSPFSCTKSQTATARPVHPNNTAIGGTMYLTPHITCRPGTDNEEGVNLGAILGGLFGGLVLLALIIVGIIFVYKYCKCMAEMFSKLLAKCSKCGQCCSKCGKVCPKCCKAENEGLKPMVDVDELPENASIDDIPHSFSRSKTPRPDSAIPPRDTACMTPGELSNRPQSALSENGGYISASSMTISFDRSSVEDSQFVSPKRKSIFIPTSSISGGPIPSTPTHTNQNGEASKFISVMPRPQSRTPRDYSSVPNYTDQNGNAMKFVSVMPAWDYRDPSPDNRTNTSRSMFELPELLTRESSCLEERSLKLQTPLSRKSPGMKSVSFQGDSPWPPSRELSSLEERSLRLQSSSSKSPSMYHAPNGILRGSFSQEDGDFNLKDRRNEEPRSKHEEYLTPRNRAPPITTSYSDTNNKGWKKKNKKTKSKKKKSQVSADIDERGETKQPWFVNSKRVTFDDQIERSRTLSELQAEMYRPKSPFRSDILKRMRTQPTLPMFTDTNRLPPPGSHV